MIPARIGVSVTNGKSGRKLKLKTGYELTRSGRVNTSRAASQDTNMSFVYTMKDGPCVYNSWEHLGFRYLEIPAAAGQVFTRDDISAALFHAEVPAGRDSTLATSDEMLNRVFALMKRSALYGAQNTFVDTPTREKGQFLASADRHWSAGNDIGRYNAVYPNGDGKRDIPDFTLNLPLWVWRYYMQTGDETLLAAAYPYMQNTAGYAGRHIPAAGPLAGLVVRLSGGGNGKYKYGNIDWPPAGRFGYDTKTSARTTVNALCVQLFDIMALFRSGRAAQALRLLTNTDDLGWAQLIAHHDATFTWEQWTVGQHQSQSHGWGSATLAQLLEHIAGVKVTQPGARCVRIRPLTAGLLDSAESCVVTERGPVRVSYSGKSGACTLKIDIPANVRAKVVLPDGQVFTVGSGVREHVFQAG